jgi:apolipoprotein N-acyltransferase
VALDLPPGLPGVTAGGATAVEQEPRSTHAPLSPPGDDTRWAPYLRLLVAAASGYALFLSFPPRGAWWLSPFAVAALALVVRDRRPRTSYLLAFVFGLALFVPLVAWTRFVGVDGWLLLALAESAIFALIGPALAITSRLPYWPLWISAVWVLQETIRDRVPFGGFPWGRLAFGQAHTPYTRVAALGGAPLVTAAVALTAGLLVAACLSLGPRRFLALGGALAVCVAGLLVRVPTAAQDGTRVVAAIQGNVPRTGLDALGQQRQVLRNHVTQTEKLAAEVQAGKVPAPDIVLWPENSSDLDPFNDPLAASLITQASVAIGRPILVGAVLDAGPGKVKNAGFVWGPSGEIGPIYVKRHPVPFGEYLPYRSVVQKLVTRFAHDMPNDFVKGTRPGVMPYPATMNKSGTIDKSGTTLADVICFEVAEDGIVRDAVRGGGQLLVVQTNNASFGRSDETWQQLAMTQLRAVEHGRAAVVVSTSGVSAIVAPDGTVTHSTRLYTAEALEAAMPLRSSRTIADRVGSAPEWLLATAGAIAIMVGAFRRRSGAQQRPAPMTMSVTATNNPGERGGQE